MNPFILLSLTGGLLAVDDRAGWQSLLAQPVFAAAFVGLIAGEMAVALPVGLILELVWLSILPMRGSKRPNQALGAITGAGSVCLVAKLTGDPRVALLASVGALLGLIAGELGGYLSNRLHRVLNEMLGVAGFRADAGRRATAARLTWMHAASIGYIFVVESIMAFAFLSFGYNVAEWSTDRVGGTLSDGAILWTSLASAIGVAAVVQLYWRRQTRRVLLLSWVLAVLVLWLRV
jgi:mannose/fructose/N-acetylgalactosamine-specific phosphotransferase system component IIC